AEPAGALDRVAAAADADAALVRRAARLARERLVDRVLGLRAPLAVDVDAEGRLGGLERLRGRRAPRCLDVALVVAEGPKRLLALPRLHERDPIADHPLDVVGGVEEASGRRLGPPPHRVGGSLLGLV